MLMDESEVRRRFSHHPPKSRQTEQLHEQIRAWFEDLTLRITPVVPECREASTGVTKLEEAMYWFNAAIARNQDRLP